MELKVNELMEVHAGRVDFMSCNTTYEFTVDPNTGQTTSDGTKIDCYSEN